MRSAVRRMGNSSGLIVPKPLLEEIGARAGDEVDMTVEQGRLVVVPIRPPAKRRPREGWAEDARRLAEEGDDGLVWPEFGNEGDADLRW